MPTFSVFPGAHCACCSWKSIEQCKYYLNILPTFMVWVTIITFSLIISLKYAVVFAFTLRKLQQLARSRFAVRTASYGLACSQKLLNHMIYPFKHSALDLQFTYKKLIRDNPTIARFHLYEAQCDMWIDLRIVAIFFMEND